VEPTAARTQEGEWLAAAAFDPDGDGNYEIRMGRVVADEFGYSIYDAYTPELDRSCASLRDPELVRFRDGTSTVDQFVLYYTCKPKTEDAQSRTEVRGVLLDERGHIASDPAPAMTAELAGAFAEGGIEKPVVVPDNPERPTEFRMWFVGKQGVERAIGVAHSATPMGSFAPYSGNPILKKGALPCAGCTIRSLTTSGADAQTGNLHLVVSTEPPPDRDGSTEFWFLEQSWMQPWRLDP
jgi:hypothetical protein